MRSAARAFDRHDLIHDFIRAQVSLPTVQTACAKFAAVGANRPESKRKIVRRSDARPVKRRRCGDQDRFDEISVAQTKEKFARCIFGTEDADDSTLSKEKQSSASFARKTWG